MFLNEMFNIGRMFDGQILDVELESGECTFEKGARTQHSAISLTWANTFKFPAIIEYISDV